MENKLLIFDGTSILAESYYKTLTPEVEELHSLREPGNKVSKEEEDKAYSTLLQARKGIYINAVQVFFRTLLDALDKTNPSHIIVTWGAERENNFRRKIFPGYKNDGRVKDNALIMQQNLIKLMLTNMGIYQVQGFESEALDLAATIAEKFKNQMHIEIFARNLLSLQLTDVATVWYKTSSFENIIKRYNLDSYDYPAGTVKMDSKLLLEYMGLHPHQIPDYRALVGSSFSKIPGIKSVGQVTTTALLEEYDIIENLYYDIDSCKDRNELIDFGNQLKSYLMLPFNPIEYLVKGREEAFLGKQLATYKRDVFSININNLKLDELSIARVTKTAILKELKKINLCPIKAKFTSKLNSTIDTMPFSSLIMTYHPHIFSSKSDMFISGVESLEDSIPAELKIGDNLVVITKLHDDMIVNFRDKIIADISNSEFYSSSQIQSRIKEKEEIQNQRRNLQTTTSLSVNMHEHKSCSTLLLDTTSKNKTTYTTESEAAEVEERVDVVVIEDEDCEESSSCALRVNSEYIDEETEEYDEEEIYNEEEIQESTENTSSIENNINSNTNNKINGLQLVESIIINKYYCGCCDSEFVLIDSAASFCTLCGAKM